MDSNAKFDARPHCGGWLLWVGGGLAILTLLLLGSVVNRPSMLVYQNFDDALYSSIGVQWAANGEWRPASQPFGAVLSDNYFAANPILTPYLTGASIKLFGLDRWVFKVPSLVAFLVAGSALSWMLHIAKLDLPHGLVVLFSYYACPWLYFAMNSARAEPLCIAAIYLAMLFALVWAESTKTAYGSVWLLLSGALVVIAAWNHLLFTMAALLPVFAIWGYADKASCRRGVLIWLAGASLMLLLLVSWRILPHWGAWKEQFVAHASNSASIAESNRLMESFTPSRPFPFNELVELKSRFSTLGWPFVCWYAGLPFLFLAILRPTRLFLAAFFLLLAWLAVIEVKTIVVANYVVNVALSLPLCLMLAASKRKDGHFPGFARPLFIAFVVLTCILHAWLVLKPATRINDWSAVEQQLEQAFSELPPRSIIRGDIAQGMVPAWKYGHTYYLTSWSFLENVPTAKERLNNLAAAQAHCSVENVNGQWRVVWQGSRKRNVEAGEDQKEE